MCGKNDMKYSVYSIKVIRAVLLTAGMAASVLLAGCAGSRTAWPAKQTVKTEEESKEEMDRAEEESSRPQPVSEQMMYVHDAAFTVVGGRIIPWTDAQKEEAFIEWYVDPFCPDCTALEEAVSDERLTISEQLPIRYHVLGFLSDHTADDYSNRAGAFILCAVENAPARALAFFDRLFTRDFQPDQSTPRTDEDFRQVFLSVGGTAQEWDTMQGVYDDMHSMVKEASIRDRDDEDLKALSPVGWLTVPFVLVGKDGRAIDFPADASVDELKGRLLGQIDAYVSGHPKKEEPKRSPSNSKCNLCAGSNLP